MVVGDRVLEGVEGSSIRRGIARDRLLELPETWLPVDMGTTLRFDSDAPPANEVFLTIYPAASVANGSVAAMAAIELDPPQQSWVVKLPRGHYVLTLSRTWDRNESVSHAFGVEVRGPDD